MALHDPLVVHRDAIDVDQRRTVEGMADLGIEDALEVPLDDGGIDRLAIVEFSTLTQLEGPRLEVLGGIPFTGDRRNDLHARIEIEQSAGCAGQGLGDEVDEVAMG